MNKFFKFVLLILISFVCIINSGCASKGNNSSGNDSDSNFLNFYDKGEITTDDEMEEEDTTARIYAAAYNDNLNYDFWVRLNERNSVSYRYFLEYANKWGFETTNRVKLTLSRGVKAIISLLNGMGEIESQSIPDINGVCYLFPKQKMNSYTIQIDYYKNNLPLMKTCDITEDTLIELDGDTIEFNIVDLMFVIDTTGSMINELNYLKQKVRTIINQVKSDNPGILINLSFVAYRDEESEYITKYCDFSSDIDVQINFLRDQIATGGGDYEESVVVALQEAYNQSWSENSIKLLVHIGDAYDDLINKNKWCEIILALAGKGIRMISVAATGANQEVEYLFRTQSLLTNGTYVCLQDEVLDKTDNYGQTFAKQPKVESFDCCLVRLINGYYTGTF